jgi:hypothetical protein
MESEDEMVGPEFLPEVAEAIIKKGYYISAPIDGVMVTITAPTAEELIKELKAVKE